MKTNENLKIIYLTCIQGGLKYNPKDFKKWLAEMQATFGHYNNFYEVVKANALMLKSLALD